MSFLAPRTIPELGRTAAPLTRPREIAWLLCLVLTIILTLVPVRVNIPKRQPFNATPVWGKKPLLGYFVFTPSLVDLMRTGAGLSQAEFKIVQQVAKVEVEQLRELELESLEIIQNPSFSLEDKIKAIEALGYNQKIDGILQSSADRLERNLDQHTYRRFILWIENRWVVERLLHGNSAPAQAARTYRVFATRYDSGGAYTVALPDKCLKFANAGNHVCDDDGYQVGQGYSVFISYQKSTAATVLESGPWNVDDNYWSTTRDPQPRRMFADLPLGIPEAQAAYFDGYNGGEDQFGRKVTAPFGIDLARQVSIDIGLEPGKNDWIDVSFLWTEGWGKKSSKETPAPGGTQGPLPTLELVIPIQAATPGPNGSIEHIVQPGQTLIGIAFVYQIELSDLLSLNNLSPSSLIHPGDRLVIKPADTTPTQATQTPATGTPTPTRATPTIKATLTLTPTHTITQTQPVTPGHDPNQQIVRPALSTGNVSWDPMLVFIAALTFGGVVLILAGIVLNRRK